MLLDQLGTKIRLSGALHKKWVQEDKASLYLQMLIYKK